MRFVAWGKPLRGSVIGPLGLIVAWLILVCRLPTGLFLDPSIHGLMDATAPPSIRIRLLRPRSVVLQM